MPRIYPTANAVPTIAGARRGEREDGQPLPGHASVLAPPPRGRRGGTASPSRAPARRARARARARRGDRSRLDAVEERPRPARELVRPGARAGSTSGTRRTAGRAPPAPPSIPSTSLSREDRRHDRVVVRRQMLHEPPDALDVVGAVADLSRHAARAGPGARPARARPRRPRGRGRRPPRRARARPSRRPTSTAPRARRPRERLPLRLAEDDGAAGLDDGELLRRDRLSRRTEHVRVLERHVRQHDDAGRVEDVRRVVATAEPGLDDGRLDVRIAERDERRRREHLELRRAEPFGRRPNGCERGLEVGLGAVDPDALRPRAHVRRQVRARRGGPRRGGAPRSSASSSTCRSSRRRGSPRGPPAARRARRAARASARARNRPPATARGSPARRASDTPAVLGAEQLELAPVALELRSLAVDHVRPARSRRSARSRACPRPARSPCARRARSASTSPVSRRRSGRTTAAKIRRSSSLPSSIATPLRRNTWAASLTRSSASCASAWVVVGLGPRRHDQRRSPRREGATRSPRSRAASAGAGAPASSRAPRAPSHGSSRRRRTGAA